MTTRPEGAVTSAAIIQVITDLRLAILQDDDEGLAEHAEPMVKAKELIAKLSASPFLPVQGAVKKLEDVLRELITDQSEGEWDESTIEKDVRTFSARILSALEPSALDMGNPITLTYTNYRGETSERAITPIRPWFGSTEWHPEQQWFLRAYDHDKGAERDFALKDFGRQQPSAAHQLTLEKAAQVLDAKAEEYEKEARDLRGSDRDRRFCSAVAVRLRGSANEIRALSSPDHADAGKVEGDGWKPIESAPKDGTVIDLWSTEFGRQPDCYWGKRSHCCGEDGQHCDSDWHSEPEAWIDSAQNTETFDDVTHWRPLPSAPSGGAE